MKLIALTSLVLVLNACGTGHKYERSATAGAASEDVAENVQELEVKETDEEITVDFAEQLVESAADLESLEQVVAANGISISEAADDEDVPEDIQMDDIQGFVFNKFMEQTDGDEAMSSEGMNMTMELVAAAKSLNPFKISKTSKQLKTFVKEMKEAQAEEGDAGQVVDILVDAAGIAAIICGAMTANPFILAGGVILVVL